MTEFGRPSWPCEVDRTFESIYYNTNQRPFILPVAMTLSSGQLASFLIFILR